MTTVRPDRIYRRLAGVQHRQRDPGLDGGLFVFFHRAVVAVGLVLLIAEIFYRLEIQQAVDRLGVGVGVGIVHGAPDRHPPFGGGIGEPHIENDGHQDDGGIGPAERPGEHASHQHDLENGGKGVEQREAQHRVDAGGAARDDARQAAGAPFEMELERQGMKMAEGADRQVAHRALGDLGEYRVADLRQRHHHDAAQAIGQYHEQRHRERTAAAAARGGQRIGGVFESIGRRRP